MQVAVNGVLTQGYTDLTVKQGATLNVNIKLLNADGTSFNLLSTSANVSAVCRTSYYTANSVNLTVVYIDSANGNANIGLTSANTANLKPINYVYEVNYVGNDGTFRILEGLMLVTPSVLSGGKYNF
jgi:hypothetical protein